MVFKNFTKGIITFQTILMVASPFVAIVGAYYTNMINTSEAISKTKEELSSKISSVEMQTTVNTTNISNIDKKLEKIDDKLDQLIKLQYK